MGNRYADYLQKALSVSSGDALNGVPDFYRTILRRPSGYKVFVGRGSSVLLEIVEKKISEELDHRNDIMSDAGFLLRADEVVAYYIQYHEFPAIDLVDEAIAYGRGLNTILLEWEGVLTQRLFENGVSMLRKEVRKQLAEALQIHILLQKNYDNLLLDEYKSKVKSFLPVQSAEDYEKSYADLQNILLVSDKVNAVYTVACQLNDAGVPAIQDVLLGYQYAQVQPEPIVGQTMEGFQAYDIYMRYFPSRLKPKAISVVRLFRRRDKSYLIPYVYFMDMPEETFARMTEEIQEQFGLRLGNRTLPELSAFGRAQNELASTIINYKLLQSLIRESRLEKNQYIYYYNQVQMNLGGNELSRGFLCDLRNQPPLLLETYHGWLSKLTDYVKQPFSCTDEGYFPLDKKSKQFVRNVVRRTVYKKSVDAECAAYHALNGGLTQKMLDRSSKRVTLPLIISYIYKEAGKSPHRGCRMSLDHVIAELMLMMDCGYVATVTCDVEISDEKKVAAHSMRVSESSLGLYPTAYAAYIPLLIEVENQCLYDWRDAKEQLELYVGEHQNNPELARELWCLVKSTHKIGCPIESLEWYAKKKGIKLERNNAEVQQYRRWFFDY